MKNNLCTHVWIIFNIKLFGGVCYFERHKGVYFMFWNYYTLTICFMYVLWKFDGFVSYDFGWCIRWLMWFVCVTPVYWIYVIHGWGTLQDLQGLNEREWNIEIRIWGERPWEMKYRNTNWGRTPPVLPVFVCFTCDCKVFDIDISKDWTVYIWIVIMLLIVTCHMF